MNNIVIVRNYLHIADLYVTFCYEISCDWFCWCLVVYQYFINSYNDVNLTYRLHYPIKP